MKLLVETKSFPLDPPFRITGHTFTDTQAVWVSISDGNYTGRGEGIGSYYLNETPESMLQQIEKFRDAIEEGITSSQLVDLMPVGGARNAVDCALWDLEAKRRGMRIFDLLQMPADPVQTVATIGIGDDGFMAQRAHDFSDYQNLKIKLDRERPIERVKLIREACPDASLIIDANQAWDRELLDEILPGLADLGVELIEQPVSRGADRQLAGIDSPVPIGADESCLSLDEYQEVAPYYDVINIKLDKCGGLTEALMIAQAAQLDGKHLMVGNMMGTSLSMAPSFVIAQLCDFVDIDGPLLLEKDIENGLEYGQGGWVQPPSPELWG